MRLAVIIFTIAVCSARASAGPDDADAAATAKARGDEAAAHATADDAATIAKRSKEPPHERAPWYKGVQGRRRILHMSITLGVGLGFLAADTVAKDALAADTCRWCAPPAIDEQMRKLVVWEDTQRADTLSTIDAYILAPLIGGGLLIASDWGAGFPRFLDDTLPVAETVVISQSIIQIIKNATGRQRPYARFHTMPATSSEQNLSFPSGHAGLGFAITAAAGTVCHWRHYRTEPYVWASGIALSVTTEYLRMAADKHYFTDVLVGGGIGLATGLLIPRLMREDVPIVPVHNGVAFVGSFD